MALSQQWTLILQFKMLKNKTTRIISISPTGPKPNKTSTPIKNMQHPTRSNTAKSNQGLEPSTTFEGTYKKVATNDDEGAACLFSYFQEEGPRPAQNRKEGGRKDQILNRIASRYDADRASNSSLELIKKTEISGLREVIRNAKLLIRAKDGQKQEMKRAGSDELSLEATFQDMRVKISDTFSVFHKQLYAQQRSLCHELQLKMYELREKQNSRNFQHSFLRGYIEKCESDVDSNYESIIKGLDYEQLKQIVDTYVRKIQAYTQMLSTNYKLKLQVPDCFNQLRNLKIVLTITEEKGQLNCQDSAGGIGAQLMSQPPRPSVEKHTKNARSAFEEVQALPFHKIKVKRYAEDGEARVSSARGKY